MRTLTKLLLPLTLLIMPMLTLAQTPAKISRPTYVKGGFAIAQSHNSEIKNFFKTPMGYEFILGKEIIPEVSAEITESQLWAREKYPSSYEQRVNFWSIGANILWTPNFNGFEGIDIGIGGQYKTFSNFWTPESDPTFGYERNEESESYDGIGFTAKVNGEFKLGEKVGIYTEIKYDLTNVNENGYKTDIGATQLAFGLRFLVK